MDRQDDGSEIENEKFLVEDPSCSSPDPQIWQRAREAGRRDVRVGDGKLEERVLVCVGMGLEDIDKVS